MTRRKITEEAEQQAEEQNESDNSSRSDSEREQLTQRMPTDLVEDVDDFAEAHGMSRNAAINFLCKQALNDW